MMLREFFAPVAVALFQIAIFGKVRKNDSFNGLF